MKTQNRMVTLCIFLFYFQKIPSSKLVKKKKWDYKKIKKYKRCLCCAAHCLYPDIMKLCIQNPVVMGFHSRMGTVNAATLNVGRLLYKGQLSHWEGWQLDRGPTNKYSERHNESGFTLPPPSPDTLRQTSRRSNPCPPLCLRQRKTEPPTQHRTVLGERDSQSQQTLTLTWLQTPESHATLAHRNHVQSSPRVNNTRTIAQNHLLLGVKTKNSHPDSFSHRTKALKRVYLKGSCWDPEASLETELRTICVISPSSDWYWLLGSTLWILPLIWRTEVRRRLKSYKADRWKRTQVKKASKQQ